MKLKIILISLALTDALFANMYHIKVLSDKTPDLSDITTFGHDIGDKWQTDNEKAIMINYWISQLTSYSEPLYFSRQWDDPIAFLNSNKLGMCSEMTLLFNAIGEGAFGMVGRHHELGQFDTPIYHTVPEIRYNGTLHLFDPSFGFAYGHYDNGIVTSMEDYATNPYFSRHNTPTALTRDSDGNGPIKAWLSADIFGWSIDRFRYDQYAPEKTWIEKRTEGYYGVHNFDITLKDGEYYTRYWHQLDGLANFNSHDFFWPHYNYGDTNNFTWNDPDTKGTERSNGFWAYSPDLSDEESYESATNLLYANGGLTPSNSNQEAEVVFKIDSANFVTGVLIEANLYRATSNDTFVIEASSSGGNYWFPIWENEATGERNIKENISDMIRGTLESQDIRQVDDFLVRVHMKNVSSAQATLLKSIKISTVTMLSTRALPKLKLGKNEITIAKAKSQSTYQTKKFNPILTKLENGQNDKISWHNQEAWKLYASDFKNITAASNHGNIYAGLWKSSGSLGWVTYRLEAPRDIKKARLGGSFIVRENSSDMFKIKYRVYNGSWSNWREVASYDWDTRNVSDNRENQTHLAEWNIDENNVRKIEFKTEMYKYPHLEALHMEIDYEAKDTPQKPLYISYSWTEYKENGQGHLPTTADAGITRTYKKKITSLPAKFSINTGGDIQPRMNWVSTYLEGNEDPNNHVPMGYSDGVDKGDTDRIPMINYEIGEIISIGKSISLSTTPTSGTKEQLVDGRIVAASDGERGNEGGGKVETQNDADDIVRFSPGFDTLDIVIDLGSVQSVGGVRLDSFKENFDDYFPESISVEIATNQGSYTHVASDAYKSAKYAHNLWPIAWSLPIHANAPSLGRFPNYGLFSNYTFIPFGEAKQARYIKIRLKEQQYNGDAKGVVLTEAHVYDKLIAKQWSPRLKHAKDAGHIDPPQQTTQTIDIEAESANLVASMHIQSDPNAVKGKYITSTNSNGEAIYTFNIARTGNYTIYARTIAENSQSNSFFVSMDNENEDIWDLELSNTWHWGQINSRSLGAVKSYHLTAGQHTLHIKTREENAKLDYLVITNDNHTPAALSGLYAPTNLHLTATQNSVHISWQDNTTQESGYKIFRDGHLIKTLGANSSSYTDRGLQAHRSYTYTIKATNDN